MTLDVPRYSVLPLEVRTGIDAHLECHGCPVDTVYRIDRLGDRWLIHTYATPTRAAGPGFPPLLDAPVLIPAGPSWED